MLETDFKENNYKESLESDLVIGESLVDEMNFAEADNNYETTEESSSIVTQFMNQRKQRPSSPQMSRSSSVATADDFMLDQDTFLFEQNKLINDFLE